ncbi:MAG: GNAT family N-acetyltransferase [Microthrixaceae bacterium]
MAEVRDNEERNRFEIHEGDELAGFADYRRRPGRTIFVHTEIDPRFEGKGMGSQLVRASLDVVRAAGDRVVPLCPFYASFIERHAEYQDLVDQDLLSELADDA